MTVSNLIKFRNVKAVVFDMDGTLCLPQAWMFPAMRKAIGLNDSSVDILTFIDNMETKQQQMEANDKLALVEKHAMQEMTPQPNLVELFSYLQSKGISKNICTRNLTKPVAYLVSNFVPRNLQHFDHIVTREFRPTKPNPDPLLYIAKQLNLKPSQLMMVGDSYDDMKSGHSAGCSTVLLLNSNNKLPSAQYSHLIDAFINDLSEIQTIIESHQT